MIEEQVSFEEINQTDNRMDWDSPLQDDGQQGGTILLEGDYPFVVTKCEKSFFNGSEKLEPCPKAVLTLSVTYDNQEVHVQTNLLLNRALEWKISSFFRSIGQKTRGQVFTPDWDHLVGAVGRAHFCPRKFTGRDGNTHETNEVKYFIDWDDAYMHQAFKGTE